MSATVTKKIEQIGASDGELLKLAREAAEDGALTSIAHLTVFGRAQLARDLDQIAESKNLAEEPAMAALSSCPR